MGLPPHKDEMLLRLNANPEFMGEVLSDLARSLMRASLNNGHSQKSAAVAKLRTFLDLCFVSQQIQIGDIVQSATSLLSIPEAQRRLDRERIDIATKATQFLLDISSPDNAAMGRAERSWRDVETLFGELGNKRAEEI